DLAVVRGQIQSFQGLTTASGAFVSSILYNDPRTWDIAGVQFFPGHGGHFHVNVAPPDTPITPFGGGGFGALSATATRFGSDGRLYYSIEPVGGMPIQGRTNDLGAFSAFLPANTAFSATFYQASTNRSEVVRGRTNVS